MRRIQARSAPAEKDLPVEASSRRECVRRAPVDEVDQVGDQLIIESMCGRRDD
jgi:hypothetical protein